MILKTKNRKTGIKIKSIEFKENGVQIIQESGECDLYKTDWLARHKVKITKTLGE